MAHAVTSPPMLRLKRSTQSGEKLMSAGYTPVYFEGSSRAFFFAGARLDLSLLQAGDILDVKLLTQLTDTGSLAEVDAITYAGVRPASRLVVSVGYLANVYGVEIQMRQTAGVLRTFTCEFYDAKRIGLT